MRFLSLVLIPLFAMVTLQAAAAQTLECPNDSQPKHWHSPASNNLADKAPDQCATCASVANQSHPSCIVYRILHSEDCRDGRCGNEQGEFWVNWQGGYAIQQSLRYRQPLKFILDAGSNCWFLVWALEPVIGVEHVVARDKVNYWRVGFEAATQMVQPPIPQTQLAMVIQPAHRRSQHQLHVHIGRIQSEYRQALDELPAVAKTIYELGFDGHDFLIRYLPDLPGKQPLAGYEVFTEVAAMIPGGESSMPLYGVLVARAANEAGSWLMAAQGLTRRELAVSHDNACKFEDKKH